MKKYKLKKWVLSSIYVISVGVLISSLMFAGKGLFKDNIAEEVVEHVSRNVITDNTPKTIETVKSSNVTVNHPYLMEGVEIAKSFYDKDNASEQINSILYYKNTYMMNTGVLYKADKEFDVVSVLDGTVTSVTEDDILGKVVEITHNNNLITIYHCLSEVTVNIGDKVLGNDVIGKSGKVNIDSGYENSLLFEVDYNGKLINPIDFYNMKIEDLMEK